MATNEPTPCPVELCEETVHYTDLIRHLCFHHTVTEMCETIAHLVATLAEEQRACAERGKYLAEVDAALIAAGQDEAGGYIAYPRRIQQLAGEAQFWHFEYREAMDNYKDEAAALREARAELASAQGSLQRIQRWASETVHGAAAAEVLLLIRDLAPATCTCGAALVHQHGCPASQ